MFKIYAMFGNDLTLFAECETKRETNVLRKAAFAKEAKVVVMYRHDRFICAQRYWK